MGILISIIVAIVLSDLPKETYSSDVFIKKYSTSLNNKKKRIIRRIIRYSSELEINKKDSIILIPNLALKKEISKLWNYEVFERNGMYAEWVYLDTERMTLDECILFKSDEKMYYLTDCGMKKHYFLKSEKNGGGRERIVIDMVKTMKPDGLFQINGIGAMFFIINNHIYALDYHSSVLYDNAIEYLRCCFSEEYYLPVFSGDDIYSIKI